MAAWAAQLVSASPSVREVPSLIPGDIPSSSLLTFSPFYVALTSFK